VLFSQVPRLGSSAPPQRRRLDLVSHRDTIRLVNRHTTFKHHDTHGHRVISQVTEYNRCLKPDPLSLSCYSAWKRLEPRSHKLRTFLIDADEKLCPQDTYCKHIQRL
jgi:hypothetical protein